MGGRGETDTACEPAVMKCWRAWVGLHLMGVHAWESWGFFINCFRGIGYHHCIAWTSERENYWNSIHGGYS